MSMVRFNIITSVVRTAEGGGVDVADAIQRRGELMHVGAV
jgi:hypothetical protein